MPAYRSFILPAHPSLLALAEAAPLAEYTTEEPAAEPDGRGPTPPAPPFVAAWRWRFAHAVRRGHSALKASGAIARIPLPWRYLVLIPVAPYLLLALLYGLLLVVVIGLAGLIRGRAGVGWAGRRGGAWFGLVWPAFHGRVE